MTDIQDVLTRRIYIVKAKLELIERIRPFFSEDDMAQISMPHVVMTKELYFEQFLEGWRRKILECCKEVYLKKEFEYGILFELENKTEVLGDMSNLCEFFDRWWQAEEASGYTEIETNWHIKST